MSRLPVYVEASDKLSAAMRRVADALAKHAPPEVVVVKQPHLAKLHVLHVIGYPETVQEIECLREAGRDYAIMQYCLRTTQRPHTSDWVQLWSGAACVWSYYDLVAKLAEDGVTLPLGMEHRLYWAPLGVDVDVFKPRLTVGERYAILTSGYMAGPECIEECWRAAARADRRVYHLGPADNFAGIAGDHVDFGFNVHDNDLARAYSRSDFVAGMRRVEGFELPAAEGLLCGARPIMLDRPHYRTWFEPWARFVPEAAPDVVEQALVEIFSTEHEPVQPREIAAARRRFDWEQLVREFWARALRGQNAEER